MFGTCTPDQEEPFRLKQRDKGKQTGRNSNENEKEGVKEEHQEEVTQIEEGVEHADQEGEDQEGEEKEQINQNEDNYEGREGHDEDNEDEQASQNEGQNQQKEQDDEQVSQAEERESSYDDIPDNIGTEMRGLNVKSFSESDTDDVEIFIETVDLSFHLFERTITVDRRARYKLVYLYSCLTGNAQLWWIQLEAAKKDT